MVMSLTENISNFIEENPRTRTVLYLLGAIWAEQCLLPVPNTHTDRVMAKEVWCDQSITPKQNNNPKDYQVTSYTNNGHTYRTELDHVFQKASAGDRILFGSTEPSDGALLELRVVDSRHQTGSLGSNKNGTPDSVLHLGCPGYIKMDAYFNGNPIPGGKDIEIVYAMKVYTSGGIFDGWPDYYGEDVLDMTSLWANDKNRIMNDTMHAASKQNTRLYEQQQQENLETATVNYNLMLEQNTELRDNITKCKDIFTLNDAHSSLTITYKVKRGDTISEIKNKINACNDDHAFFPHDFSFSLSYFDRRSYIINKNSGKKLTEEIIYPKQVLEFHSSVSPNGLVNYYLAPKENFEKKSLSKDF